MHLILAGSRYINLDQVVEVGRRAVAADGTALSLVLYYRDSERTLTGEAATAVDRYLSGLSRNLNDVAVPVGSTGPAPAVP